ncbi:MAG: hypothetical protein NTW32_07995 [Chloroflexi bacterium]|nr:hypothetical protein [Chloroflexota bacterium]
MESRIPELPPLPPPPGAVTALVNGFNAIAGNVAVILFPAALDIFFWLGPRIKADALLAPIIEALPDIQAQAPAEQVKIFSQLMTDFQNGLNLFSLVRTFPMGIFSLMSANISAKAPYGMRPALDTSGWLAAFGIMILLTVLGWVAGSLYFRSVSRVALKLQEGPGILRSLLHGVLLSVVWMLFFTLANLPMLIVLWVMTLLNTLLRTILLIMLSIPVAWVLMAIFYSFYGVFAKNQNAFESTRSSIRMLRYGLPPLGWFTMLTILISQGMDLLWRTAPADSWMMGVGILGHAFVSTSLLAASFIYFRDLNIWIDAALQWLKKQNKSVAQA